MLAITLQCEVPPERTITVKLPDQIEPGLHQLVLVFEPHAAARPASSEVNQLMRFAGTIPAFATIDGVAWQRSLRDEW